MLNNFLLKTKNAHRDGVLWNAIASTLNSFQTMVLLMIITRFGNMIDSGIFVMAYAVGNLMLNVGKYGMRQFQVTDTDKKFGFNTYLKSRKISVLFTAVLSLIYIGYNLLFNSYTFEKSVVIFLICATKLIEAYEDVYHGLFQQAGRLDVGSKILSARLLIFVIGCAGVYIATKNLILTIIINTAITLILAIILNKIALNGLDIDCEKKSGNLKDLLVECFPLCACMCLNMYIANAPKYIIDTAVSSKIQTCFNIVFMPVFVIALLANFIFQPYLKKLGEIWNDNKRKELATRLAKLSFAVILISAIATLLGYLFGTEVLGFVYNVNLQNYKPDLLILMICGGIIALQNLFIIAVTVVRYQKYMIYGYIATALLLFVFGKNILLNYSVFALSLFFLFAMILLLIYCIILFVIALKKR